jgi:hypothetical protein
VVAMAVLTGFDEAFACCVVYCDSPFYVFKTAVDERRFFCTAAEHPGNFLEVLIHDKMTIRISYVCTESHNMMIVINAGIIFNGP